MNTMKPSTAHTRISEPHQRIAGNTGEWEVVIGMEVHAQIASNSKIFSSSPVAFSSEPNSNISLFDAAIPGTLPSLNTECVKQAVLTGLGLGAHINTTSIFERKHYFYADLPKGYQISQRASPIVGAGKVLLDISYDHEISEVEIGIERINLEQDAGKLLHDKTENSSLVDLNRVGIGLMEIVSTPSIRSAHEAKALLSKLLVILKYLGTCDGDMEKGNLRADINVSVRKPGEALGVRCEIKNVNSIRFTGQAIDYEARRQIAILESGKDVKQETRLFDIASGKTKAMRCKEGPQDYRYFPDPDLPPLILNQSMIEQLKRSMPELPDAKKDRFVKEYGLSPYDATVLTREPKTADYYEASVIYGKGKRNPKTVANWVTGDIAGLANNLGLQAWQTSITSAQVAGIVDLIADGTISGKIAKDVLTLIASEHIGRNPKELVEELGLGQITDILTIETAIENVIAADPTKAEQARHKPAIIGWIVGQVLKETEGKGNPKTIKELVTRKLRIEH